MTIQSNTTTPTRHRRPMFRAMRAVCLLAILLSGAFLSAHTAQADSGPASKTPRVLQLNSYHPDYYWSKNLLRGIKDRLHQLHRKVTLDVEYMDTKRNNDEDYFQKLFELYKAKFAGQSFDAILCSDDNALAFLQAHRDTLFPGVPVIFCGVEKYDPDLQSKFPLCTGIIEQHSHKETIDLAKTLQPAAKKVVVVCDDTTTGKMQRGLITSLEASYPELTFVYLNVTRNELIEKLAALEKEDIVLFASFFRDAAGIHYPTDVLFPELATRSNAPIYIFTEALIKNGVLGGHVVSGYYHGAAAAELLHRVLNGEAPGEIPIITTSPNTTILDYRVLVRFGLTGATLPANATIRNRPKRPTPPKRMNTAEWITLSSVILLLMAIIIALLYVNFRRRRWAKSLAESEQRWRTLYEGMPGCGLIANEDGIIEDVNNAACVLAAYTRDELLALPCQVIFPSWNSKHLIAGGKAREEWTHRESLLQARDGQMIPVLSSARRIPLGGRTVVIESFQDISSQKEMEQRLRASEETERDFRERLTALHELNVELTTTASLDALCRQAVTLLHERLGMERVSIWFVADDPGDIVGTFGISEQGKVRDERGRRQSFEDFARFHITDVSALSKSIEYLDNAELTDDQGHLVGNGARLRVPIWDGHQTIGILSVDTLFSGKPLTRTAQEVVRLFTLSLGHLCARLSAEQEHARLAQAIEQAAEAFVITEADGRIQYVNEGLTRMLGYATEEVIGHSIRSLFHENITSEDVEDIWQAMADGASWSGELTGLHKDNRSLTTAVTLSMIRNPRGAVVNGAFVLRDISREAALEEQVRQASKMQAIGRLAGGIAHDFNNQLTVVKGYCDLMLRDLSEDNPLYECIDQIHHATKQAIDLTSELLSFSRRQILQPRVISPNQIINNMQKSLVILGKNILTAFHAEPDLGNIRVDPGRMEQALMNLSLNARDAMPKGGTLTLEAANYAPRPGGPVRKPSVRISVRDTGTGMDRATREHVFEPFFTTKAKGEGTGLGLSMVYGFVQQSGGHIEVTGELGVGSCFDIYLPRVSDPVKNEAPEPKQTLALRGTGTILLVEDDLAVRKLVQRVLTENGYTVQAADDPHAAIELVRQNEPFDMMITDVVMPTMSGTSLAKILLKIQPDLRILFISGYTEEEAIRHDVRRAKVHFLGKPFPPNTLLTTVAGILKNDPADQSPADEAKTPPDA